MKTKIQIIPLPDYLKEEEGQYLFEGNRGVCINVAPPDFKGKMEKAFSLAAIKTSEKGIPLSIEIKKETDQKQSDSAYTLKVSEKGITISAATETGAFYGCVSAAQLISAAENSKAQAGACSLPFLTIVDEAAYKWRGFLLDTCRSFFSISFIKKMLDACALHKLNVFHWHLTDDQGWRFEVPGYPRLTEVGSIRQDHTMPEAEDGFYDEGEKIRRWYTDEEIKEIIEYAAEREIEIVPEVEFPGHASALLAAYPNYGCTGGPYKVENRWGIFPDVLCLGNDEIFTIYEAALKKIVSLFPGKYIHIGGDECMADRWSSCPKCQARMKDLGLESPAELQTWATIKITRMVLELGKIPIGWDEVLDNNNKYQAPEELIVQSWRGTEGGIKGVEKNHPVIMSPQTHFYLNLKNRKSFEEPGRLGTTTIAKTYSFSPAAREMNLKNPDLVIGGECTFWSEKIQYSRIAEYLLFPRFCAAAEAMWLKEDKKDFADFSQRLENHKRLLKKLDFLFYDGELD